MITDGKKTIFCCCYFEIKCSCNDFMQRIFAALCRSRLIYCSAFSPHSIHVNSRRERWHFNHARILPFFAHKIHPNTFPEFIGREKCAPICFPPDLAVNQRSLEPIG